MPFSAIRIWRFASATALCACRYCSSRMSARWLFAAIWDSRRCAWAVFDARSFWGVAPAGAAIVVALRARPSESNRDRWRARTSLPPRWGPTLRRDMGVDARQSPAQSGTSGTFAQVTAPGRVRMGRNQLAMGHPGVGLGSPGPDTIGDVHFSWRAI